MLNELFFYVCNNVKTQICKNKEDAKKLNSACKSLGKMRLKNDKPSSLDSDEYRNFLKLYKTTINPTNESSGKKGWMENVRITNSKYARMLNEIFSWDEQKNTFVFTDRQRITVFRELIDKDTFKPGMIPLLSKSLESFESIFQLCYSNEPIKPKDVLGKLKTALENIKKTINDVWNSEVEKRKEKLGLTEDKINAIETHYIFKEMIVDFTNLNKLFSKCEKKFPNNNGNVTEKDILDVVKENAEDFLGSADRFETLFGARYEELCNTSDDKKENNVEENRTEIETNNDVKNDVINIKDIMDYTNFREYKLDLDKARPSISKLCCSLAHQLYSLDNKVGKIWMNQAVKKLFMNMFAEVSQLEESYNEICTNEAANFLNVMMGCFELTEDDFVTNNDIIKEKKITKEVSDFIRIFGNPGQSSNFLELQQVQSDYMNSHEPTKDEILNERMDFCDWLCEQYCTEEDMKTYAKTLCMTDPTMQNLQPLTLKDKTAIMDIMMRRGIKRFEEANARLNPPLISPEELKANPKYKDMPDIYKNIYKSHYSELSVEGNYDQDKILYCQDLLKTYGNPQDSVIN